MFDVQKKEQGFLGENDPIAYRYEISRWCPGDEDRADIDLGLFSFSNHLSIYDVKQVYDLRNLLDRVIVEIEEVNRSIKKEDSGESKEIEKDEREPVPE
jgi:hypothetical protein